MAKWSVMSLALDLAQREPFGLDFGFLPPCYAAVLTLLIAHHLPFHGLLCAGRRICAVALHGVGAGIGLVVFELIVVRPHHI